MNISEAGKAFIKARESCRLEPYRDVAGYFTVGWGHLMQQGDSHAPITQGQADEMFERDIQPFVETVNELVTTAITQEMFDAIVSVAFNIGGAALRKSTFLQYVNAGQFEDACIELLRWRKAGGKNVEGLLNRRAHEILVFARGEYE